MTEGITIESRTAGKREPVDESTEARIPGLVSTLANALWFPTFFMVGFMVFYLLPFHSPTPHDMPVVVVGQQAAQRVGDELEQAAPGGFVISSVPDDAATTSAIQHRDAVAGYNPATHTLFVAKANGIQLARVVEQTFAGLPGVSGQPLQIVDLAPPTPNDAFGTSLFYLMMVWNIPIPNYIVVMMMLQAALPLRRKLLTLVGYGAAISVVTWAFGLLIGVIPDNPSVLVVAFLLGQAVSWTTLGLSMFVGRAIPGVAMGLFVLLSIPSSGGAIPFYLLPQFFHYLHPWLPLGAAIDAARSVLYLDSQALGGPLLVLLAWWILGGTLVAIGTRRQRRAADTADADEAAAHPGGRELVATRPLLVGRVLDETGQGVADVRISVLDADGEHVDSSTTTSDGRYVVTSTEPGARVVVLQGLGRYQVSQEQEFDAVISHRNFRLPWVSPERADEDTAAGAAAAGVVSGP